MKSRVILPAVAAACLFCLATNANAYDLWNMAYYGGGGSGCCGAETSCCGGKARRSLNLLHRHRGCGCEAEAKCGVEQKGGVAKKGAAQKGDAAQKAGDCCGKRSFRFRGLLHRSHCGCDDAPKCGAEPKCGVEQKGGVAQKGAAQKGSDCCGKRSFNFRGLLHRSHCGCDAAPKCGVDQKAA